MGPSRDDKQGEVLFLQPPSPPYHDVLRDYAGGFGVALPADRPVAGHGVFTQPYLSLVYAATIARDAGVAAAFIDGQAESLTIEALRDRVAAMRPRAIVAVASLPSLAHDLAVLAGLKETTGADVVVCGTVCRAAEPLADLLAGGIVDVAVTGDIEQVVAPVLQRLLSGRSATGVPGTAAKGPSGQVHRRDGGELDTLESLPVPAFDMLPMDRYVSWEMGRSRRLLGREYGDWPRCFPLYRSHGCPHCCSYCPYPLGYGKRWRSKPVERYLDEVRALVDAGTTRIIMRDQAVSEDPEALEQLCKGLLAADLRVEWYAEARPASMDAPLLRLARKAGCRRIGYGVETGDPEVFRTEAKRGVDPAAVRGALRDTMDAGIDTAVNFLVGFPHESWSSVAATLDLIESCGIEEGSCALMTPYPGTRHYEKMRAEGRLLATSWEDYSGTDPIVRLEHMSPVELVMARWRILAALDANTHVGVRRRVRDLGAALSSTRPNELAALVDGALSSASRAAVIGTAEGAVTP